MKQEKHIGFHDVFRNILSHLPERSQEIVAKRFGVIDKKPMTLQAIGDDYGITRERVRQIVQSGLKSVRDIDGHDEHDVVRERIIAFVDDNHGIVLEDCIVQALGGDEHVHQGSVRFFIEGMPELDVVNARKYPVQERVVILRDFDIDTWHDVHTTTKKILEDKEVTHASQDLHKEVVEMHSDLDHDQMKQYLHVSREVGDNPFDKWGLVEWDEISPRGVREKALLIMKEKNTPLHFREIAALIDEYGLGKKGRKSHPQTVHNELIRDDNFVLVGRGVYALNTDSYIEGTVKDVIENVLQNSQEPLTADEVVDRVLEMRYVKPSTVKVNLNAVAKKLNKDKKYTLDSKTT